MSLVGAVLLTAVLGTAIVSGCAVAALLPSLHALLWELCVREHRARFWERACLLAFAIGVTLAATIGASTAQPSRGIAEAVGGVLRWELAGGCAGVLVIAGAVLMMVRRFGSADLPV